MGKIMQLAIEKLSALPANEQDLYAEWILARLEAARAPGAWPQPELERLAQEASAEYAAGTTKPLEFPDR
ncbi:MAG: hypothetical protein JNL71_04085 [Rhodospirillales bacterium]|nr:hypothetical protein [Rhodospirillales bacterium]